jgi:hypothetical protein
MKGHYEWKGQPKTGFNFSPCSNKLLSQIYLLNLGVYLPATLQTIVLNLQNLIWF